MGWDSGTRYRGWHWPGELVGRYCCGGDAEEGLGWRGDWEGDSGECEGRWRVVRVVSWGREEGYGAHCLGEGHLEMDD